jgi:mRNA-degrading endonuclease RelE of RelBE toxin-antitoxin system
MKSKNKTVNINIRVTEAVKKDLQKLADADKRTVSDFIRLKLEELAGKDNKH